MAPTFTCQLQLDEDKGSRRDFTLACLVAVAATTACCVLLDRLLPPTTSLFPLGMPLLKWPGFTRPSGQHVGSNVQIAQDTLLLLRFRTSGTFTSREVWKPLFTVCDTTDVDASWRIWRREAAASLARVYLTAGALPLQVLAVTLVGDLAASLEEAISPYALSDWEAGVRIVSLSWIMLMSLMSPTLASSSTLSCPCPSLQT